MDNNTETTVQRKPIEKVVIEFLNDHNLLDHFKERAIKEGYDPELLQPIEQPEPQQQQPAE